MSTAESPSVAEMRRLGTAYGTTLAVAVAGARAFNESVRLAFENMSRMLTQQQIDVDDARERRSQAVYRLRIERERRAGLLFVQLEAHRARRELGLP